MSKYLSSLALPLASYDPFNGISPSFGPFSGLLESKIGIFLSLVWAVGFVFVAYHFVVNVASIARSGKGGYGDNLHESRRNLLWTVVAAVALASVPVLYATVVAA